MREHLSPRYRKIIFAVFFALAVLLVLYFALSRFDVVHDIYQTVMGILAPFLAGALIAFILKPLCNRLDLFLGDRLSKRVFARRISAGKTTEKRVRHLAEALSIAIALIFFLLIIAGIIMLVVPSLISSIHTLGDDLPTYLSNMDEFFNGMNGSGSHIKQFFYDTYQRIKETLQNGSIIESLINNFNNLLSTAGTVITTVMSVLVDILITVVSSVYILYNRKRFAAQANMIVRATFKRPAADWLVKEAQFADRKFSEFFSGKLLDSFIVGIVLYIVLTIFRIPQAPLIAVFMAFCNMIPFFGPYIGAIPCFVIVLMADITHPINVFYFLIIVVVVQQLDGNILDPFIVGDNIGLSSFWVLFAVVLFGDLFGFIGLLIGVPIFAVIYDIIRQLVNRGLRNRGEEQLMTDYNFIYHDPEEEREARKKRATAIKEARRRARAEAEAERAETLERELAVAQAAAAARAEAQAKADAEASAKADEPEDAKDSSPENA